MTTTVITGANRGIGLELARLARERGDHVIAACRTVSPELEALGVEVVDDVDVATGEGADRLAAAVGDRRIGILINNAGVLRGDSLETLDFDTLLEQYRVNALGPLRVTKALLDKLREGSKVGIITSRVGSLGDNSSGGNYGYRMSKAAANMAGVNLHHDLVPRGIAVVLLHPGLVGTGMTGGRGIEPETAARGLLARIEALDTGSSGRFWHAEGHELPW